MQSSHCHRSRVSSITLYIIKILLSASVIVVVAELSKWSGTFSGGVFASLPLTSLLTFIWLYWDTRANGQIIAFSWSIFWLVLPSLTLFVSLPVLLKRGLDFPVALLLSLAVMVLDCLAPASVLRRFGVRT